MTFHGIAVSIFALVLVFASAVYGQPEKPGKLEKETSQTGEEREIRVSTSDGVTIVGTHYAQKSAGHPSILLLHMLARDRATMEGMARRLQSGGFNVLAIDLRGHGESTEGKDGAIRVQALLTSDFLAMDNDVEAAIRYLRKKYGDKHLLGIVGASIGANLALRAAAADQNVAAVVLLSPSLDYRGIQTAEAVPKYGDRPIFILAGKEDTFSADGSAKIAEGIPGKKKFKLLPDGFHGTNILLEHPELEEEVVEWLKQHLEPSLGEADRGSSAQKRPSGDDP